ncbi:MAG TPA: hypothetical protein VI727_00960, partial [Candidatus Brocadiaceae bacterium]|nr:hypothetical protein [Candidatus Brocadiaceae bacterium]
FYLCRFSVGWVKRSEPTIYKINEGEFGVKTNALIHPTHNLIAFSRRVQCEKRAYNSKYR